ncbi:MAG TPA: VWA domain-containing protein [Blastocatellia bacterium]|nr:VWA domain-containing protein [Blastocatellia bacterium]
MKTVLSTTLAFLVVFSSTIYGQEHQPRETAQQTDKVVRIGTDLFQTDVMVFDRQGRFVDGLKREEFELRVDGKPQQISFFDIVAAGTPHEASKLATVRGETKKPLNNRVALRPEEIGRTIFFFVDDLHLSADSVMSTRRLLRRWIDEEMGIRDRVGIIAASGAVGFLQQLSDNKAVLRAAVARLSFRNSQVEDIERPAMNEFQALAIEKNDPNMVAYFLEATVRENPMFSGRAVNREAVESHFRRRAASIARQSAGIATRMLATLQGLLRSSAQLTGSKLVFFISDGFFLQTTVSDALENLRRVTDAAAHAGIVIYTVDARGLVVGLPEARSGASADQTGALARASGGQLFDSQDGLNALAADTGGRAIRDTNALDAAVRKVLDETSQYYVLAWHSQAAKQDNASFRRIEVSIAGRPDLSVRAKRGFYDAPNKRVVRKPGTQKKPAEELIDAVKSSYPGDALGVSLNLGYLYSPDKGPLLAVSLRVAGDALQDRKADGQVRSEVDVFGLVLDDQGRNASTFKQTLQVASSSQNRANSSPADVGYRDVIPLASGLYQVRVAARDASGRIGGAHQWIEIPEFQAGRLALSSVFVWERTAGDLTSNEQPSAAAAPKIDRQFAPTSQLRFMIMIYNAAAPANGSVPEIEIRTRVLRDNKPVVSSPARKVSTTGVKSLGQIPYGGEFSLEGMAAGVYIIEVTVTNRATNAIQRSSFEIK